MMLLVRLVADTARATATLPPRDPMEVVFVAGSLVASVAAILGVGIQWGKHSEFKETTDARIGKLEASDNQAITREELDARFAEMRALIHALSDRFGDLARHLAQPTASR